MTLGEKLLELSAEYHAAKESRGTFAGHGGNPVGREPSEIAAEYEQTIKELLA